MLTYRIKNSWHVWLLFSEIVFLLVLQSANGFVNSPKIITKDGNLIFESGLNRNITFRLNGKSRININDEYDLLSLLLFNKNGRTVGPSPSGELNEMDENAMRQLSTELGVLRTHVLGREGLDTRLRRLQNRTRTAGQLLRRFKTQLQLAEAKLKSLRDQLDLDNCKSNPCENGGTCYNMYNGFICKCTNNFEGTTCEKDVNECALFKGTDLGCLNGAQCVNQFGGYTCICSPGWFGIHCAQRKGDCMQSSAWELCGHGTCVSSNDNFGYKCICDQGWKTNGLTPSCTVDVDECQESHPRCETKCINLPGSFTCAPCAEGLTGNGINCRDINECETENGGCSTRPKVLCLNTYGSYHCGECPLGWTGDGRTCARQNADENGMSQTCANSNMCHPNATCTEISNTIVCSCPAGMIGSGIGANGCVRTNCKTLPCLNGGSCVASGSDFACVCPPGLAPPNCTPIRNVCITNPCHNNGMCRPTSATTFQCQCSPGYTGRLCETRFSRCGGMLVGTTGRLKYPEGSLYEHNAQCAWVIRTNATLVLNVTFNLFELEDSTECRFDWLQINDGRTAASQIIGRFCGSHKPMGGNIISSTNDLYLWFRSDNITAKEGFDLEWSSIPPQCGGIIEVESHGTIATPGSPGNYPKNRDCVWELHAPNNKRIKLTFFSLQIEEHDDCNYDYVEIADPISNSLVEKFCNSSHPSPILLPTNKAEIHFHSDNVGSDTGFQIYYSLEDRVPGCGGTFTAKEGSIKSPTLVDDLISCEYDIKMSPSESIRIEFVKLEMGQDDQRSGGCVELYDVDVEKNIRVLQSRYCRGYDTAPTIFQSMYNTVQVKYYTTGPSQFELHYKADCSFTYESSSDAITSPSYPKLSNVDRFCSLKILTEPNTVISINIADFDLKDSTLEDNDCTYTYLTINDNDDTNILGPFCGNNTPPRDIVSKTNMVTLSFKSSLTSSGRGFKIEYKAVEMGSKDCGGVYTKPGYTIRLPTGEDGLYMNDMKCYWIIMAPVGKGIMINWKSFALEQAGCMYDYIEIYDNLANSEDSKPLGRFCETPPAFVTYSRILSIKFVSDTSDAQAGFEATYSFVDTTSLCGGEIMASSGQLNSPKWPLNYTNDLDCIWTITAPPSTQVQLLVDVFDIEDSDNCSGDWLEIRNGGSAQSTLVGYFCGKNIPRTIPSFTNQMHLHFHADSFVSGRGFQIKWHIFSNGCGGNLNSELGVITSPSYPNPYPHNAACEWHVRVNKGSAIHFTIEDLEIEELFECNYDYLELFDGNLDTALSLGKICSAENNKQRQFVTVSNEAFVRFHSDGSTNERGFLLSYYANCTRTITDVFGVIESPNYGDSRYKNDVNCTWTIKAPKGNQIFLELTYFDNVDGSSALYFSDISKNASDLQVIREIKHFNTTGDTLVLMQNSSMVSFRLEYRMIGCVQLLHRDSGEFQSPNFPKPYPNDVECLWEIKTALGHGIELTVEMDLEESFNCSNDALQISSHLYINNTKERHCGRIPNLIITSSSHHMYVRFFSNSQINGRGFNATYRTLKSPCGGILKSKNGVIQSPNYPLNYPPNSNCEWTIEVSSHHTINLTLEDLNLELYYEECELDFVEAYEELGDEAEEKQIFKKCGKSEGGQWTSKSNIVIIRFQSDDSIEAKGFKLSYQENCGERVMVDDYDYRRIEIVKHGPNTDICEWQIIAKDPSKHIVFTITHVQLNPYFALRYQNEENCVNAATIYDGVDDKSPMRSKFCKTHPPAIISNGHALTIKVPLDVISEFEADYMTFDSYCGGFYDSISGKFSSPYYPSSYPVNIMCTWYIRVSQGNSIVLTIETLDLEQSDECNNDYLEVREQDQRGRMLGVFCGSTAPGPLVANDYLWLKFKSDNDNVGQGFLASYNYAQHNEINGTNGTIESPRYPTKFSSDDLYSWRITVDKQYLIVLTVQHIIDVDIPFIKFYDGYSDIGAELDFTNTHIIRSNTNFLYITASRGPFQFEWEQMSKEAARSNRTAEEQSELCGKQIISVESTLFFQSPGYPHGYRPNLDCNWIIIPSNRAMHAVVQFIKVDLEAFPDCFADYVTISSSSDLQNWKELKKLCEKPTTVIEKYEGTPYLKMRLFSDANVNKTGFAAYIRTACGSEMTDRKAFVNITSFPASMSLMECVWTIRVRQSRRIRITFPESYFQNSDASSNNCRTYFMVRNGIAEDSPFLGNGKYCDNNITDVLETTSNRAYIKFARTGILKFRASFHYEEITHECSDDIILSDETPMDEVKTITSPNYPNIPNPHTECIWKIEAPLHHAINIEFIGNFDLAAGSGPISSSCDREYVQINDGSTELLPMIGRYCGSTKPDSKFSSGNVLRVKYFTDISEPHAGFMANVSIRRCGGSYYTNEGAFASPDKLILRGQEREFECVYTIEVEKGFTIGFTIEKMEMPASDNCSKVTHVELQEIDTYGDSENMTDMIRLCGSAEDRRYIVETNKLIVRYKIKDTSRSSDYMFKINYVANGARCGETIVASRGLLYTPGYPGGVKRPTHCSWRIRVNKGKRIKIEFLDFDTGAQLNTSMTFGLIRPFRGRLTFANDLQMQSIIARISENPPTELYSTDNTMAIDAFLLSLGRHRGFKLRFSSNEDSEVCRNVFNLNDDLYHEIHFRRTTDTNIYCSYALKMNDNETLAIHVDKYDKGILDKNTLCSFISPLKLEFNDQKLLPDLLCNNETEPSVRVPFPITFKLSGNKRNQFQEIDLRYRIYKCGGILPVLDNLNVTQPILNGYTGVLECAWAIWPNEEFSVDNVENLDYWMDGAQLEVSLYTDFKGNCEDQYLLVYNGPNQNSPHLGRYCNQASAPNLIVERGLFLEYYTKNYEKESTFNLTVKLGSGCGGKITYPYREIIFSEQYQNNVECIWELETEPGFQLGLSFVERFFIESSTDCKKDYLKVQQKNLTGDWVDLQTICGRNPPESVNTTSTEMRLIFRSDGDTLGDGFTAHFERTCGGILYATNEEKQLSSPGYPKQYENNLVCNYTILPKESSSTGVLVRFIDFEIEEPPVSRCMFDNVTISLLDSIGNNEDTVLCGMGKTYEFRGNSISIVLRTDQSFSSKGFLLEYSTNVCGGLVTRSSIIETPRHHSNKNFPPNSNCYWNITAPEGNKILIKFEELDFEGHSETCTFDGVQVYKSLLPIDDQRIATFCGNLTGSIPILSIPNNKGLIHSFSDSTDASKGFRALITFTANCDRNIFLGEQNSTFTFNTYASGYTDNLDCSYTFSTNQGRQFLIDFSSFHVEESENCQNDYLEIRDGTFSDLIGRFCGHTIPTRLMSTRNNLFMRFVSDSEGHSTGFNAIITTVPLVCGQHRLKINSGEKIILKSPESSDGKYPINTNCFWRITSDKNIHLKFDKFDIDSPAVNGTCDGDYLKIHNSEDEKSIERGDGSDIVFNERGSSIPFSNYATEYIYCGSKVPDDYYSTTKDLLIKFRSDGEGVKSGFQITATAVDGCFRNFTGTQGRILLSETSDHCDVYIRSPQNYSLSLYYTDISFGEYDCNTEYIEVFDSHTNTSLQKICNYAEVGKSLFTNTNELRMRLKMNTVMTQYDITYLASRDGPGCGGDLYNTAGLITSPFYPNNVRNNSDCRWNIRVPSNLHVLLQFDIFDLGVKTTCHSDYLQIIEHNHDGSETVARQFCGEDNPKMYKSVNSAVTVRFHKTVNYDGTGWVIRFSGVYSNYKIPDFLGVSMYL